MFVLSRPVQHPVQIDRVVDRLFNDSLDRYFGGAKNASPSRAPALDGNETDSAYTLAFDVPGVTREQLKVSIEGRRVSLETVDIATPDAPPASKDTSENVLASASRVLYRERSTARYARTVSLPTEVDQSASSARFDNGVLILSLAKKMPAGPTTLNIG